MEMETNLIAARDCCVHYNIQYEFVEHLQEAGLIEIHTMEQQAYIAEHQLPELERYSRLHYELDINIPGLEAISHLLRRIRVLQDEIAGMKHGRKPRESPEEFEGY